MDINYTMEVRNLNRLVLLETNERINYILNTLGSIHNITPLMVENLRIDKESIKKSLEEIDSEDEIMAQNIISKIEYIIETSKE